MSKIGNQASNSMLTTQEQYYIDSGNDLYKSGFRRLTIGGFGVIWRQRERVVKLPLIFIPGSQDDGDEVERIHRRNDSSITAYENEIRVFRRLGCHAGIVKADEANVDTGIIMEYISGGDLHDYIGKQAELSTDVKTKLLLQLAEALKYLHKSHDPIYHNDIRLPNIVIDKKASLVKLIDFSHSVLGFSLRQTSNTSKVEEHVLGDIFDFATVAYQVWVWESDFHFPRERHLTDTERTEDGHTMPVPRDWPIAAELPKDNDGKLGQQKLEFLRSCWLRKYGSMQTVCDQLATLADPEGSA